MLYNSLCQMRVTDPISVATGVTKIEEGRALIGVREGGTLKAKASVGAANTEEFIGFALNERTAPEIFPHVMENAVVILLEAGKWGVNLPKTPVGTPRVAYAATGAALTAAAGAPNAGEYRVTGSQIEVNSADLNKKLNIVFNYVPNIADLMYIGGDNSPTTFSTITSLIDKTGVIEQGVVYTSCYDVTIDWASWTPAIGLKATANGVVGVGAGTGATIRGRVIQAPTQDIPYLGLDFSNLPAA